MYDPNHRLYKFGSTDVGNNRASFKSQLRISYKVNAHLISYLITYKPDSPILIEDKTLG